MSEHQHDFASGRCACGASLIAQATLSVRDELPPTQLERLEAPAPALLTLAYQYASECRDCDGLGAIEGDDNQWRDCDGCADIRKVIKGTVE